MLFPPKPPPHSELKDEDLVYLRKLLRAYKRLAPKGATNRVSKEAGISIHYSVKLANWTISLKNSPEQRKIILKLIYLFYEEAYEHYNR